jgi:hypothetical protein
MAIRTRTRSSPSRRRRRGGSIFEKVMNAKRTAPPG